MGHHQNGGALMTTYVNAKAFTGTGPDHFASAFTIEDGKYTWVGETEQVADGTETVDLGGATVLPGLLDVHTHPIFMATLADTQTLLQPTVTSLQEMIDELKKHPEYGKGPDAWVLGFGYNEDKYPDGKPDRHALDRVSTTQPVFAYRADGHTAVCNSFALEVAGIDETTPDPDHGVITRDENGVPTGGLVEKSASDLVMDRRPAPDRDDIAAKIVGLNERLLGFGIVAVDDLYGNFVEDPLEMTRTAAERGYLPQSGVFLVWGIDPLEEVTEDERTGRVRVAGVKVFMDGAFSNRTAWVEEPYPDSHNHGIVTVSDDDLRTAAAWARRNGVQMAVHVMGDRGINHLLDMFENDEPWLTDRPSIRFDHSTLYTKEMMERTAKARMNFGVISHSVFFYAEYDSYEASLGEREFKIAYPLKSMYENLPLVAIASDSPATAWEFCDNPFISVMAAVCRKAYNGADINQAEALSVGQALELITGRAAQISTNRDVGVIADGYEGNFVVLDRDVFTIDPESIDQTKVLTTYLRGDVVFQR